MYKNGIGNLAAMRCMPVFNDGRTTSIDKSVVQHQQIIVIQPVSFLSSRTKARFAPGKNRNVSPHCMRVIAEIASRVWPMAGLTRRPAYDRGDNTHHRLGSPARIKIRDTKGIAEYFSQQIGTVVKAESSTRYFRPGIDEMTKTAYMQRYPTNGGPAAASVWQARTQK